MNFRCFPLPALKTRKNSCGESASEYGKISASAVPLGFSTPKSRPRHSKCWVLGIAFASAHASRQSQPVAASRSQSQTWWPSRHRLRLSLISTVTCLRWVQISPGVIGGNRIEADYSQDGSMDQNSYPLLVTAKNGVTKNPCFNVAPNFWTFTDLLEVIPPSSAISRTLKKKKLGYNVVR